MPAELKSVWSSEDLCIGRRYLIRRDELSGWGAGARVGPPIVSVIQPRVLRDETVGDLTFRDGKGTIDGRR
jgi:hypothetical protein